MVIEIRNRKYILTKKLDDLDLRIKLTTISLLICHINRIDMHGYHTICLCFLLARKLLSNTMTIFYIFALQDDSYLESYIGVDLKIRTMEQNGKTIKLQIDGKPASNEQR